MNIQQQYIQTLLRYPTAWEGHASLAIKLVELLKPKVTVDLGVDFGFSTFSLAYANTGEIYGIDWFQGDEHTGYRDTMHSVLELYSDVKKSYSIPDITFVRGDFNEIAKVWTKPIDILHIDGLHTYDAVKNDYEKWSKFCTDDSVILFHDVESFGDTVGRFFHSLEGFKYVHTGSAGLGLLTKNWDIYTAIINTI